MKQLRLDAAVKISGMSLKEIEDYLQGLEEVDSELLDRLKDDSRTGTTQIAERYIRYREEKQKERKRLLKLKEREEELYREGYDYIAGVDEVGRGPLAGPVMAAAVIMPKVSMIEGIDDSKRISTQRREELNEKIISESLAVGIGVVSVSEIDSFGIGEATRLAMQRAIEEMEVAPEYVLIDGGIQIPELEIPHENVMGGDARCYAIASASIAAKVKRDRFMMELDADYPEYGFAENKGYGTENHLAAVERCGYSAVHRSDFRFHDKGQLKFEDV